jgi:hypothetical protein
MDKTLKNFRSEKNIIKGGVYGDWVLTQLRKIELNLPYAKLVNQKDFRVIEIFRDYYGFWYCNSFKGISPKQEKSLKKMITKVLKLSKKYGIKQYKTITR